MMPVRGEEDSEPLNTKRAPYRALTSAAVRRRLALCLFLHIAGVAMLTQIYPKVVLEHFNHDDRKASTFSGWLTLSCSIVEFIAIPSISSASDVVGRRRIIAASLALSGMAVLALGLRPDSLVAVAACQIVSSICAAILPVSQAVVIDISLWNEGAEGGEVSHGLGIIAASFGIALGVGPIFGGLASEDHRSLACWICAGMSALALLSLRFYGWSETAPARRVNSSRAPVAKRCYGKCSSFQIVNPLSNLKILLKNSLLMQLSVCLCLYSLATNVYTVYYNYFDYRYHWGPLEISIFFSVVGVILAFTTGVGIRVLVPKRLSEGRGVAVGMLMHATASVLYGVAPRGWMLYPIILAMAVQYITDPCIQAIMARLVDENCQGRLQGAITTLRIVAQGIAAAVYGQVFSFGLSNTFKNALGFVVPGLPLFLSAQCSLMALVVASCALRQLDGVLGARVSSSSGRVDAVEEGVCTVSLTCGDVGDSAKNTTTLEEDESLSEMSEPLLGDTAPET